MTRVSRRRITSRGKLWKKGIENTDYSRDMMTRSVKSVSWKRQSVMREDPWYKTIVLKCEASLLLFISRLCVLCFHDRMSDDRGWYKFHRLKDFLHHPLLLSFSSLWEECSPFLSNSLYLYSWLNCSREFWVIAVLIHKRLQWITITKMRRRRDKDHEGNSDGKAVLTLFIVLISFSSPLLYLCRKTKRLTI